MCTHVCVLHVKLHVHMCTTCTNEKKVFFPDDSSPKKVHVSDDREPFEKINNKIRELEKMVRESN